jgi:putative protein-disulfide isomerase
MTQPILYYVHDPMCSWCWAYRPTWDELVGALPAFVRVENVVGGLAPDSDELMPPEQQLLIAGYWREIADQLGTEFNFDFWSHCSPRRSTYPACRAVLAAKLQGAEALMIDAIQRGYYLRALNPSDSTTLVRLADEVGLDVNRFARDIDSSEIQKSLDQQFDLRRSLGVFSFPTLVLELDQQIHEVVLDYKDHQKSLDDVLARVKNSPDCSVIS